MDHDHHHVHSSGHVPARGHESNVGYVMKPGSLEGSTMDHMHTTTMDPHTGHSGSSGTHDMFFHAGVKEVILFDIWRTNDVKGIIGSVVGIILLGILYEAIKVFREHLKYKSVSRNSSNVQAATVVDLQPFKSSHKTESNQVLAREIPPQQRRAGMLTMDHFLQTVLHVIQVVISYFLMLIFMTYNVWLCLAVTAGSGLGYFLLGWLRYSYEDMNTEHCY